MTKINSLLDFLREQKQKKGRPLKIICDWDECLKAVKPYIVYQSTEKKISFDEYFKDFWEEDQIEKYYTANFQERNSASPVGKEKEEQKDFVERKGKTKQDKFFYDKVPYLTIADDLLHAEKDDLIERLVIISAFRKKESGYPPTGDPRKRDKFKKTFGNFPSSELELTATTKDDKSKKNVPRRWDHIKSNYSDFDILIDDNKKIIERTWKLFPDKTYILPDYKYSRMVQGPNIYHLKTSVSDLKDEDFTLATLEKKNRKVKDWNQIKQSRERERERAKIYWIIGGAAVLLILIVLLINIIKREIVSLQAGVQKNN